jgi:methyl-accepting chemotaxis protein
MKIRVILPLIISVLALMVVGFAVLAAYEARSKEKEAANFVNVNRISSLFLKSAGDSAVERGATNGALAAADPVSSDVREIITSRRTAADSAFTDAIARLRDLSEMKDQQQVVSTAEQAFHDLQILRERADAELTKPEKERDAAVIGDWVPTITDLIDKESSLRRTLETLVRPPVAQTTQLAMLRSMAAEMAEYAGRERARLMAAIASTRPLSGADVAALSTGRGHIDLA